MANHVLEQAEFTGNDYEIIPWFHGQEVLYYQRFGSYQGDWAMLTRNPETGAWYIWKGCYGSCSGCDAWEGDMDNRGYGDERKPYLRTDKDVQEFVDEYKPFLEIDADLAYALVDAHDLESIMPRNERAWVEDTTTAQLATEWELIIALTQAPELLCPQDAFRTENAETRRRIVDHFGADEVLSGVGANELHVDGPNRLLQLSDGKRFLHLQDSSTPRRYLLRVPPTTETVLDGIAWSFSVDPNQWKPLAET